MTGPQTGRGRNQKGNRAEVAVVAWLKDWRGLAAERIRSGRSTDAGDITWPGSTWLMDCKDHQRWRVQEWFREAEDEAALEPENVTPVLVLKRPGITDPGQWLAVVRLEDLEGL